VLLYELLTAETPFRKDTVRGAGPEEIRWLLREVEPPKPSMRLQMMDKWVGVVAMRRQADPSGLVRQVQGDLDCIVMKCLEKDRERRYESPAALAMDVLRHLQNQPIQARPPSVSYRALARPAK
jgi:serine/threonine protein kinase